MQREFVTATITHPFSNMRSGYSNREGKCNGGPIAGPRPGLKNSRIKVALVERTENRYPPPIVRIASMCMSLTSRLVV
jgi:hypothetical protein